MLKNILFICLTLFLLTEGLIFIHNSKFERGEYDRICNDIYTEKFWIDTCYLPYKQEIKTFENVRNIEVAGIIISGIGLLYFQKFNLKH
ncbi:hypothetical protein BH10PAT1_BH10PAT1_0690 [soil metagenome]